MLVKLKQWHTLLLVVFGTVFLLATIITFFINYRSHKPERNITWAALMGDLTLLKQWEATGESLDIQDSNMYNWTPLMAAISYPRNTNIIQYLITKNINLNLQDSRGDTALMLAIAADETNTVRLLLEKGADITIKDKDGMDAFTYANVTHGNARVHRELFLEWLNEYKIKNKSNVKKNLIAGCSFKIKNIGITFSLPRRL
jgi:hypothetical protein